MNKTNDANIIARVRAGYLQDFEQLVRLYEKPLFRIVGNLLGRNHRVEDLVQEIFLAAFQHLDRYDSQKGRFSTWLFRIARNKTLNEIRENKGLFASRFLEPQWHHTPSDDIVAMETMKALDQALNDLPFQFRVVFVLAEIEGLAHAEIADIEKIRPGTVKSRLSRAKAALRKAIGEKG
jgi:RNA polymerase sigma-70 factor (ECF subfamily)